MARKVKKPANNDSDQKRDIADSTIGKMFTRIHVRKALDEVDGSAQPPSKRPKNEVNDDTDPGSKVETQQSKTDMSTKCKVCRQEFDDPGLRIFEGPPNGAMEEAVALFDPRLSLFNGNEEDVSAEDVMPQNKLTYFSVFDEHGHLCFFDNGLIEKNALLYVSGYIKPVYDENPSPEDGVPAHKLGPISEWWITGFDGGENGLVGISTPYCDYYLMDPSPEYEPFMKLVRQKTLLSKTVFEFLYDAPNPTYEELLNRLQSLNVPKNMARFDEDTLMRNAQFIIDQVSNMDAAVQKDSKGEDEELLITTPAMRSIIRLTGVTPGKRIKGLRKMAASPKNRDKKWTKATTTYLVAEVFESFFPKQLDNDEDESKLRTERRRRCNVCEACQQPDCGECVFCRDMVKFGGSGRGKQACKNRRCPYIAIGEAEESDPDDEELYEKNAEKCETSKSLNCEQSMLSTRKNPYQWDGKSQFADVNGEVIHAGDYVFLFEEVSSSPMQIAQVVYFFKRNFCDRVHCRKLCRGSETVLGEMSHPQELFFLQECADLPIHKISMKIDLKVQKPEENWYELGGVKQEGLELKDDGKTFFAKKRYNQNYARFEDILDLDDVYSDAENRKNDENYCATCKWSEKEINKEIPLLKTSEKDGTINKWVEWRGEQYKVGNSVFLHPETFEFKSYAPETEKVKPTAEMDDMMYPELYRKAGDTNIKGCNEKTPDPFNVGYIVDMFTDDSREKNIKLKVKKFYRPQNTHLARTKVHLYKNLNLLYWSEEEVIIPFTDVEGKCYVRYIEDEHTDTWLKEGPNRFYFQESYNAETETFETPKSNLISNKKGGKGKGKGKNQKTEVLKVETEEKEDEHSWPEVKKKLRTLDVFAGCGGLTEGLHQSGISETLWAIEQDGDAAMAFKKNFPQATVFSDDCNALLKEVMSGKITNGKGQKLPQKGEVDLICGGPPCQGFSGMNRFNSRQYSQFKNSLVVSFLSYCDYYRPKYFILENVRNFVAFKRSMVLKQTLFCLISMGYQCTFGVLQAGNYGVPQTRRRLFILAAAPHLKLPLFPEPTHVFSLKACNLQVSVDEKRFNTNCRWTTSAPYRTITVRDALSDLPEIPNGADKVAMNYSEVCNSHFQRMMRGNEDQPILRDHICKYMSPLVEARIRHIPTAKGSDWRDLPNISMTLSDGTTIKQLKYNHHDRKNGKSSQGHLRGVCACASGRRCDPLDRQYNTLIPWCLPHTGNRHNHWSGLYGRLEWDGYFSTTVTNPEPMGKQGRVLHPEQTRVVSVRECARSQGFPDTLQFYGPIIEKHRQVGNAVPPPMARALGLEIRKCLRD
ncbi:UNVERIFIED_CONTAM: hypothetical protein PYX00_005405 [Menopon gallinae]|uniref:Cytosine-specific methyltransferase n=1 Tax=Menopon gallinae TaxID=328185 RepID=A0AAW2HSJ7_9NEOP